MRIFIALLFSEAKKAEIYKYLKSIESNSKSGNFTSYNNLHLTMQFIGETDVSEISLISQKLSEIKFNKFTYKSGDIQFFNKNKSQKIVYLGLEDTYKLKQLYIKIEAKLAEIGMDFSSNNFTPHITLGRKVKLNDDISEELFKVKPLTLKADRISLMESTRVDGLLTYLEIYSSPLN